MAGASRRVLSRSRYPLIDCGLSPLHGHFGDRPKNIHDAIFAVFAASNKPASSIAFIARTPTSVRSTSIPYSWPDSALWRISHWHVKPERPPFALPPSPGSLDGPHIHNGRRYKTARWYPYPAESPREYHAWWHRTYGWWYARRCRAKLHRRSENFGTRILSELP